MVHSYDTCWRVPIILNRYGKHTRRIPIIYAVSAMHAKARVIELYREELERLDGEPYLTHRR